MMYVKFNNVPSHILAIVAKAIESFQGNFDDGSQRYPHINYDQKVVVEGSSTVIITGQRCALWGDEHAPAMRALLDAGVQPEVYKTSDSRLAWHETLDSYMTCRGQFDETLAYCRQRYILGDGYGAFAPYLKTVERLRCSPLLANAEYDRETISRSRRIIKMRDEVVAA